MWVIERFENERSQGYWAGESSRDFVADIDRAVQFVRREDAWRIRRGWHWKDTQVTEHLMLASPEPPRQIADTLDDSLHEINIVGADPRNSIDHAISERTRRILAHQKPVPTIEEVVDALKSGDAFVVGHRDEKQDLSRQSPMYRDAAAILGEIGKSKFAHTQTLKLMNWKLEMAPSSHSEPELVKLRQIRLLARWDGPDAAPKRMHEIWEKLGAIIENLEMRAALASTKS